MMKDIYISRLKEAREKKGFTLKDLAEKCGVSLSAMNRYVALTSMPNLDIVEKMADTLGVSIDWLCGKKSNSEGKVLISNCADTATALDQIVDKYKNAIIEPYVQEGNGDYDYPTRYYVSVQIESEALYQYFSQMEATHRYLKELPPEMKEGFLPYKEAMEEQLRKKLVSLPHDQSGIRPASGFTAVADDTDMPF